MHYQTLCETHGSDTSEVAARSVILIVTSTASTPRPDSSPASTKTLRCRRSREPKCSRASMKTSCRRPAAARSLPDPARNRRRGDFAASLRRSEGWRLPDAPAGCGRADQRTSTRHEKHEGLPSREVPLRGGAVHPRTPRITTMPDHGARNASAQERSEAHQGTSSGCDPGELAGLGSDRETPVRAAALDPRSGGRSIQAPYRPVFAPPESEALDRRTGCQSHRPAKAGGRGTTRGTSWKRCSMSARAARRNDLVSALRR